MCIHPLNFRGCIGRPFYVLTNPVYATKRMCTHSWGSEAPPQRMCTHSWGSELKGVRPLSDLNHTTRVARKGSRNRVRGGWFLISLFRAPREVDRQRNVAETETPDRQRNYRAPSGHPLLSFPPTLTDIHQIFTVRHLDARCLRDARGGTLRVGDASLSEAVVRPQSALAAD